MGPALGASCTWVWIRFRPRNHRIWPRRSSRSAWSISSTSSLSSSSGISSFCVSLPASLRNLSLLVGMVAMTCRGPSQRQGRGRSPSVSLLPPVPPSLFSHPPSPLTYLPDYMFNSLLNSSHPFLNSTFKSLSDLLFNSLTPPESGGHSGKPWPLGVGLM